MICLICRKAELIEGYSPVTLDRLDTHIIVTGVPAGICPNCGERYLEEKVALRLLLEAERLLDSGVREVVWHFQDQGHKTPGSGKE